MCQPHSLHYLILNHVHTPIEMRKSTALLFTVSLMPACAIADAPTTTIVEHITTGTEHSIAQPDALLQRLFPIEEEASHAEGKEDVARPSSGRMAGYRVQVFSDNNARTAKAEANTKQRLISSRFPQYQTYVMYTSPYWRLKVGDFRTQQEATAAADELRKAFPSYSKEIRVVRDRVNISAD